MDRKEQRLRTAQRIGRVQVEDLATDLNVSAHTIRRDLNTLCAEARLRLVHGGAEFVDGQANMPYGQRAILNWKPNSVLRRRLRIVSRMAPASLFRSGQHPRSSPRRRHPRTRLPS